MLDNGEVTSSSSSSEDENREGGGTSEEEAEHGDLFMVRRLLGNACKELDDTQRENISTLDASLKARYVLLSLIVGVVPML